MPEIKPNWALLGGLRFVLALFVALLHLSESLGDGTVQYYIAFSGATCVAVFLIISGFCMAHSFGREREGFYRRRFWRIWPTYALATIAGLIPFAIWGHHIALSFTQNVNAPSFAEIVAFLTCLPTPLRGASPLNASLWTVGVECVFYALAPALAILRPRYLVPLILASAAVQFFETPLEGSWLITDGRVFWSFGLGWLLYTNWKSRPTRIFALILPLIVVIPPFFQGEYLGPALSLTAVGLILNMEKIQFSPRTGKFLLYLGDLSFPLYAVHFVIGWMIALCCPSVLVLQPGLVIWLCLAVAALWLHCIDRPLRRFGREPIFPRRPLPEPALSEPGVLAEAAA